MAPYHPTIIGPTTCLLHTSPRDLVRALAEERVLAQRDDTLAVVTRLRQCGPSLDLPFLDDDRPGGFAAEDIPSRVTVV